MMRSHIPIKLFHPIREQGETMLEYTMIEILQTQEFDTIIQTLYGVALWAFITIRLNRIENNL